MVEVIMQIKNLTKCFPGVVAVNNVNFDIIKNTVHCLVGENGAGKSTLINILTGTMEKTSGSILLHNREYNARNTREAREFGISTLFQELNTVNELTVEENLTLGQEDTRFTFLRKTDKVKKIIQFLKDIDPKINPKELVKNLSVAQQQIIEIVKAVASESEIIIMDEATAALSFGEVNNLFKIIKKLKEKQATFIYISHRLDEVFEIGDNVTVMRDGNHICTKPVAEIKDRSELIKMMIGKTVFEQYIPSQSVSEEKILEVKNATNHKLKDISFSAKKGEIVGFYGLVGAGKTELARVIFGLDKYKGEVYFKGEKAEANPSRMIKKGMVLVPEERRTQGVFSILTVKRNISVMNLQSISKNGFISSEKEEAVSQEYIDKLSISTPSTEKEIAYLSGGNQQKAVFAKCLLAHSDMLILDEPTRGIDVGAKEEIYSIIRELVQNGKTIIMFSTELSEILNICDKIFILCEGVIKAEIQNGKEINNENILHIATGGA